MSEDPGQFERPVTSGLPARDESASLEATGGDELLAGELLSALLAGLPTELEKLKGLLEARDWSGLDDLTHGMRGATAYCGVPALDKALEGLRDSAKTGDRDRISRCLRGVELEAERLRSEVARAKG